MRYEKFNASGGFITTWGNPGFFDGQFYYPKGVAVDSSGSVYVGDTYNDRIQKFRNSAASTSPTINISTDKSSYKPDDRMIVGLNVTNPGAMTTVEASVWVDKPDGGKHMLVDNHSLSLSAGFISSTKVPITLPDIPSGNYAWHAMLRNGKNEIIGRALHHGHLQAWELPLSCLKLS